MSVRLEPIIATDTLPAPTRREASNATALQDGSVMASSVQVFTLLSPTKRE